MKNIEVWKAKVDIPPTIKKFALKHSMPFDDQLRRNAGVDLISIRGRQGLYSDGICGWHDDKHVPSPHSLLLIIRNDVGSYVESKDVPSIVSQPVGTMVYLNIWKKHRLWHPKGIRSPLGVFLVIVKDLEELPKSKKECDAIMFSYVNKWSSKVLL